MTPHEDRPRISVIVGSARPVRIGRQLADSLVATLASTVAAELHILDLREIGLPMLDEPVMAARQQYANPHTVRWAAEIRASDAVIFLTPQYNAGYPAALKNAIDYLFIEWRDRPAAIISYGGHGGGRSAQQLRQVLDFVRMNVVDEQPQLTVRGDDYDRSGRLHHPDAVIQRHEQELRAVGAALEARLRS